MNSFGYIVAGFNWMTGRVFSLSAPFDSFDAVEQMLALIGKHTGQLAWISRAEDHKRWEILRGEKMATGNRIYVVSINVEGDDKASTKQRLVRAGNPAQAIRHVVKGMVSAAVAKQDDLVALASKVAVEDAAAE